MAIKLCGVYKIVNLITRQIYIGSSVNIEKRKKDHFRQLRKNIHGNAKLQRSFNKYGEENFEFEILHLSKKEDVINYEQSFIDLLNPYYNICRFAGNQLGTKRSLQTRKKMSISQMGKKLTQDVKDKISIAKKGSISPKRKSIFKICKVTNIILNEYNSAIEAAIKNSMKRTSITNCARGLSNSSGGYKWIYKNDYKV